MSGHRDAPSEVGVPLLEQGAEAVHLHGDGVHDGLAVGGAVVEEHVQQRLVGEVPEPARAGQGDLLNPPAAS